jgi:hypothetical protein
VYNDLHVFIIFRVESIQDGVFLSGFVSSFGEKKEGTSRRIR